MFGYIIINKAELRFREFDVYHSYYCGLCRRLKERYGLWGQISLSYDMTFLILLLTGLYEPDTEVMTCKCAAHPLQKHAVRVNRFTDYAADMNVLLSYYKCMDDWWDDRKVSRLVYGKLLKKPCGVVEKQYAHKLDRIQKFMREIWEGEAQGEKNLDEMAGRFGGVMEEIFAWNSDEWEPSLRKIGFYLGKFIYLVDAYEDLEKDEKKGAYNPFLLLQKDGAFEESSRKILTMMMAECSREFEKLPILEDVEILRNILYSGVWCRYEGVRKRRQEKRVGSHG
ncbi:MAG: hypothetical protein HFI31_05540 [Lachnospiraceae bacterium]|nr:hypothetical protein [Lachnospiraceae bacterium]MCI9133636.1 hypothetical protein [Lachnospiraceae bacterium]